MPITSSRAGKPTNTLALPGVGDIAQNGPQQPSRPATGAGSSCRPRRAVSRTARLLALLSQLQERPAEHERNHRQACKPQHGEARLPAGRRQQFFYLQERGRSRWEAIANPMPATSATSARGRAHAASATTAAVRAPAPRPCGRAACESAERGLSFRPTRKAEAHTELGEAEDGLGVRGERQAPGADGRCPRRGSPRPRPSALNSPAP